MKTPIPVGFLSQYNLEMLQQGYPQTIVMAQGIKRDLPLYAKQALIDLLEAAAEKCDERANGENDAQHCADAIRSMKAAL